MQFKIGQATITWDKFGIHLNVPFAEHEILLTVNVTPDGIQQLNVQLQIYDKQEDIPNA